MFFTKVETIDGLLHLRVYTRERPLRLVAWCVCADSAEGRAALAFIRGGFVNGSEAPEVIPDASEVRPAGQ